MAELVKPAVAQLQKNFLTQQTKTFEWRANELRLFQKGFTEMRREFEDAIFADLGRSAAASQAEILSVAAAVAHDLKHLKTYMQDINEESELVIAPCTTQIRYEPMGVVGIFSAWNYPVMTALKPVVQSITAGNCSLLKPSEISSHTSRVLKKFVDRYLDSSFIQCIEGGIDVAVELNQQKLDLICFTGSTYVGKIVAGVAAKNLTRCILELGGKCPAIVHQTCDMGHTVEKIAWAKFTNSGQTCVAPDYIFVQEKVVKQFVAQMINTIKRFYGEKADGSADQGKVINDFHVQRLTNLMDTSKGEIVYGGKVNAEVKHIQPTIIINPANDSPLMNEEIFGPILPILVYKNLDEVINYINEKPKALAVYFFGQSASTDAGRVFNETSSGCFSTNECIMQCVSHYQGFGGVGESGNGRYGGFEGFKNFSNRKGVMLKKPQPAFMRNMISPPYTDDKVARVEKIFTFASLHNQSDVWFCIKVVGLVTVCVLTYAFIL